MKTDLTSPCSEPSIRAIEFGICDDQNNEKAYTDINDRNKWIATVKNENAHSVTFAAIDNCEIIYKKGTKNKESTCDGMLSFNDSLYLVELKDHMTGRWIAEAISQLENTIRLLIANNDLTKFRFKKAYACNKKRPAFAVIDNEQNKRFYSQYGFRLHVQREIKI